MLGRGRGRIRQTNNHLMINAPDCHVKQLFHVLEPLEFFFSLHFNIRNCSLAQYWIITFALKEYNKRSRHSHQA
jgi:hypothetical protein